MIATTVNKTRRLVALLGFAVLCVSLVVPAVVGARPVYFDTLRSTYGILDEENLDTCGVCHFLWEGTGARNPYGFAVEQQLYLGKTIAQSLADVEAADSDFDGFTNVDEILTYMTLPGYSCDNFQDALGAPLGYDTYITPLVASCLEPLDIRVLPEAFALSTFVDSVATFDVLVINNGTDVAIDVSSYGFVTGDPQLSINGPAAPFSIPVDGSVVLQVEFSPTGPIFINDSVTIASNDPDENPVDISFTAFAINQSLAPAEFRAACFKQVNKAYRKYTKTQQRLWGDCYTDEVQGVACDTGKRDLRLEKAEAKLRSVVGGDKDKACGPQGLNGLNLGLSLQCGGSCSAIVQNTLTDYADCLVCRMDSARDDMLTAAVGTVPPDLPANTAATSGAASCQERLQRATQKGIGKIQKTLADCELANITAVAPVDCATDNTEALTKSQDKTNAQLDKCSDTTGLAGCLFEMVPDPTCLGDTTLTIGGDLVNATFGLD